METRQMEIKMETIIKIILILLAIVFIYFIKEIIALLFIAVIIVSAINPLVDWLQSKKIPRSIGVLMIYFVLLILISLLIFFLIPPVAMQSAEFAQNFPAYFQKLENFFVPIEDFFQSNNINTQQFLENISSWISDIPKNILSTTIGVFSGFILLIAVFSLTFYMSLVKDGVKNFVISVTPQKYQVYAADLTVRIEHKIGRWLQGQIVLMIAVFLLVYLGLSIIGVPYALVLAFIAGLFEIIPYVGPIISAVPGIILGFFVSPITGLLAFLVYFVVQEAENNILVPIIMKRAVGLNPIVIILVLLIGAKLGGILGAILAVPITVAVSLMIKDLFFRDKQKSEA